MVSEPESESLEEAFRKHKSGAYRPHSGPSEMEFEAYKEGGQSRSKPSFNYEQQPDESRSLEETFQPGIIQTILGGLFGSEGYTDPTEGLDEYVDLGDEVDEEVGEVPHPESLEVQGDERPYKAARNWIDDRLEEGRTQDIRIFLEKERKAGARKTVLDYVDEENLATINTQDEEDGLFRTEEVSSEEAAEAVETYNRKA